MSSSAVHVNEVLDIVIERDVRTLNADLAELEAEYDQATGEAKANLQKKIDAAKAKLHATQDAIQAKIEASQKETEAKIKSLQEQAAKESGERKAKREARIAELKADQKRRSDLLKQAWRTHQGSPVRLTAWFDPNIAASGANRRLLQYF